MNETKSFDDFFRLRAFASSWRAKEDKIQHNGILTNGVKQISIAFRWGTSCKITQISGGRKILLSSVHGFLLMARCAFKKEIIPIWEWLVFKSEIFISSDLWHIHCTFYWIFWPHWRLLICYCGFFWPSCSAVYVFLAKRNRIPILWNTSSIRSCMPMT